jgi:hypothetical protein
VFPELLVVHFATGVAPQKKTDTGLSEKGCWHFFDHPAAFLVLTCRQMSCQGILIFNVV